jgi:hypothetical protein
MGFNCCVFTFSICCCANVNFGAIIVFKSDVRWMGIFKMHTFDLIGIKRLKCYV